MVKIRLRRVGKRKQPSFRVVVADSKSPRDGRFIENIGHYNPRTNPPTVEIKEDRALYWLSRGAQPTSAVARMLRNMGTFEKLEKVHQGVSIEELVAPPEPEVEEAEPALEAEEAVAEAEAIVEEAAEEPEAAVADEVAEAEEAVEEAEPEEPKVIEEPEAITEAEAVEEVAAEEAVEKAEAEEPDVPEEPKAVEEPEAIAEAVEEPEAAVAEEAAEEAEAEQPEVPEKPEAVEEPEAIAEAVEEPEAAVAEEAAEEVEVEETEEEPRAAVAAGEMSLEDLELSTRVVNVLADAGLETAQDLLDKLAEGETEFMSIPGAGGKTLEEVQEQLAEHGLLEEEEEEA